MSQSNNWREAIINVNTSSEKGKEMKTMAMIGLLSMALCGSGWAGDDPYQLPTPNEKGEWDMEQMNKVYKAYSDAAKPFKIGSVKLFADLGDDPKTLPSVALFTDTTGGSWLVVHGDSGKNFYPSRTTVTSKYRPVVTELPDGQFRITFEVK